MENSLPPVDTSRNRDEIVRELASRILSDAELIREGADFVNGVLFVNDEQLGAFATRQQSEKQFGASYEEVELEQAIYKVRSTYIKKQLESTAQKLENATPSEYLQHVRDYILLNSDKGPTTLYDLRHQRLVADRTPNPGQLVDDQEWLNEATSQDRTQADTWSWRPDEKTELSIYALNGTKKQLEKLYSVTDSMAKVALESGIEEQNVSFAKLSGEQRHAIASESYTQWYDLAKIAHEHHIPINISAFGGNRLNSLAYRNLGELQSGLQSRPDIDSRRVVSLFMQRPLAFPAALAAMKPPVERKEGVSTKLTARELKLRERAIQALEKPSFPTFDETLEPGQMIQLDSIEQIDEVIFATLARLEANATDTHGAPTGNIWTYTSMIDKVGAKIKPDKFYGKLANPRMVVLPADDAFIDEYLARNNDNASIGRSSFTRIQAIVDMKSTGRGVIGQSLVETVLYTRNSDDIDNRKHVLSIRDTANGAKKVQEYLQRESSAIARIVLAHALKNPLQGGLINPR